MASPFASAWAVLKEKTPEITSEMLDAFMADPYGHHPPFGIVRESDPIHQVTPGKAFPDTKEEWEQQLDDEKMAESMKRQAAEAAKFHSEKEPDWAKIKPPPEEEPLEPWMKDDPGREYDE